MIYLTTNGLSNFLLLFLFLNLCNFINDEFTYTWFRLLSFLVASLRVVFFYGSILDAQRIGLGLYGWEEMEKMVALY